MKKYFLPLLLLTSIPYHSVQATLLPKKTLFTALIVGIVTAYNMHVLKQHPKNQNRKPNDILNLAILQTAHDGIELAQNGLEKLQTIITNNQQEILSRPIENNNKISHEVPVKTPKQLTSTPEQLNKDKETNSSTDSKSKDAEQPSTQNPESASDLEKASDTKPV